MRKRHDHGEGSSPALYGDTLVLNYDHEGPSFLVALATEDGRERWRTERDEPTSWSSPLITLHEGKAQVVVAATRRVRGYDLETGRELWQAGGLSRNVVATPVAGRGLVFAGSSYDTRALLAIRLDRAQGDVTASEAIAWSTDRHTPYVPSPVLVGPTLCFLKHYQPILRCVEAETGVDRFEPRRLPGLASLYASPVAVEGTLLLADQRGVLARVDPMTGEVLQQRRLPDRVAATPAPIGNQLVLRGDQALFSIGPGRPRRQPQRRPTFHDRREIPRNRAIRQGVVVGGGQNRMRRNRFSHQTRRVAARWAFAASVAVAAGVQAPAAPSPTGQQAPAANPVEVGTVEWGRDFQAALAESRDSGKPVLAFFQEVPGCAGCKQFGREVMSHPLITAAIEAEFVPTLIYNNRPGIDAELIRTYREPAWNYQVVRFLDGSGKDLIPRRDRVWTVDALAPRMIAALQAAGRGVPDYLQVAADEASTAMGRVAFSQHCFWTGEFRLGQIEGVVRTEAGWLDGREVTLVDYRPDRIGLRELVAQAAAAGVADAVYLADPAERDAARGWDMLPVRALDQAYRAAPASDQKRQIAGSPFARLELSPMQRTKVNAFAPVDRKRALNWLTPDQRQAYRRLTR